MYPNIVNIWVAINNRICALGIGATQNETLIPIKAQSTQDNNVSATLLLKFVFISRERQGLSHSVGKKMRLP